METGLKDYIVQVTLKRKGEPDISQEYYFSSNKYAETFYRCQLDSFVNYDKMIKEIDG